MQTSCLAQELICRNPSVLIWLVFSQGLYVELETEDQHTCSCFNFSAMSLSNFFYSVCLVPFRTHNKPKSEKAAWSSVLIDVRFFGFRFISLFRRGFTNTTRFTSTNVGGICSIPLAALWSILLLFNYLMRTLGLVT